MSEISNLTRKQLTTGYPILGTLPYIRKNPIEFFGAITKLGTTVPFKLGPYKAFLLNRPEDVEYVLSKNNKNYEKSPFLKSLKFILGDGLLTTDGAPWAADRRVVNSIFTKKYFDDYAQATVDVTDDMMKSWSDRGKTFIVAGDKEFTRLTFRIISKILFSVDNPDHVDIIEGSVKPLLEFGLHRNLSYVKQPLWWPTKRNKTFHQHHHHLKKIADEMIQTHIGHTDEYKDLLSAMLEGLKDSNTHWSMERVREHMITFMLAGHETSTMAIMWTCYALCNNPGIQEKAREEAMSYGKDGHFKFDDVDKFPYIKRCMEESLRLYPPAWKFDRIALGEDQLTDVKIKKDAFVFMFPYFIQKNPDYYPNPLQYNPDNFLEKNVEARPRMSYFPFGAGPRVCIAKHISIMELMFIMIRILQNFSIKLAAEPKIQPVAMITLRPEFGMNLEFTRLD
jgi:cytochrome P450